MHKITLIMYLITSFLKIHSIKNDGKLSLRIFIGNSYSPPSFNISQQNFVPIFPSSRPTYIGKFFYHKRSNFMTNYIRESREKMLKIKTNVYFLYRKLLKDCSNKILLDNNMTHPLKKKFITFIIGGE